ncbi:hypothetical protein MRS44_006183 [Fusarium solani]|uniref:uncharacterized protein n=1 Tax=Fusarium solani TaxID=169388 RepID=UPI0032C4049A|nr:hypothetical protein MRS44_006183 [Fusarium solani]
MRSSSLATLVSAPGPSPATIHHRAKTDQRRQTWVGLEQIVTRLQSNYKTSLSLWLATEPHIAEHTHILLAAAAVHTLVHPTSATKHQPAARENNGQSVIAVTWTPPLDHPVRSPRIQSS